MREIPLEELLRDFAKRKGRSPDYFMNILNRKDDDRIPVEWIVTWGRKYIAETLAKDGVFSEKALIVASALDEMRNDWKKENDR